MEVKFHRDVNHNYMMLQSGETPDPDAYENRVILANRIRGLLPCRLLYLNGDTYYSFDITSMQSLEILRGRRILSGDGFSSFFYELIDVLCGLEEYLLDFDHLILTPDKISSHGNRSGRPTDDAPRIQSVSCSPEGGASAGRAPGPLN